MEIMDFFHRVIM